MNERTFYENIETIDKIINLANPNNADIDKILFFMNDKNYQKYICQNIKRPIWIEIFYERGLFYDVTILNNSLSAENVLTNQFLLDLLAKFADKYEDIVVKVALHAELNTWVCQSSILEALSKVSIGKSSSVLNRIDKWINSSNSEMLIDPLSKLTKKYINAGQGELANKILGYIISPVYKSQKYGENIIFRLDHYWVNEYIKQFFNQIMELCSNKTFNLYYSKINICLEMISNNEDDYYGFEFLNRRYIGANSTTLDILDVGDQLINGLRDSLNQIVKNDSFLGGENIKYLILSKKEIFERIGIYTLIANGSSYNDLVEEVLLNYKFLSNYQYENEFNTLLKNQYTNLKSKKQKEILTTIKKLSDTKGNKWLYRKYHAIGEYLTDEYKKDYKKLREKSSVINDESIDNVRETRFEFVRSESPIPIEDLKEKNFGELKSFLLGYSPDRDEIFVDSKKGLAESLQHLIMENYEKYKEFAYELVDEEIEPVYVGHYLIGAKEAIEKKSKKLCKPILDLCKSYANPLLHGSEEGDIREWTIQNVQFEIARLLSKVAEKGKLDHFSIDDLEYFKSILITLSDNKEPTRIEDQRNVSGAFQFSLNCVRGLALHGLITYSFYLENKKRDDKRFGKRSQLDPDIRKIFENKLDKEKDASFAVHSVFGMYFPWIHFYFRTWTEENFIRIFPEKPSLENYWRAAWDAYLFNSKFYSDLFPVLIPQYRRALNQLGSDEENKSEAVFKPGPDRVVNHIIIAYLYNLTDFNHENGLLDLLFNRTSDETRGSIGFQLVQAMGSAKKNEDSPVWLRIWRLWTRRVNEAQNDNSNRSYDSELTNLLRLTKFCPYHLGNEEAFNVFLISINHLHDRFILHDLSEYLSSESNSFPLESVNLLDCIVKKIQKFSYIYGIEKDHEEQILVNALESNNLNAQEKAINVINFHGETGNFQWKYLWDKYHKQIG